jgi:hypothetical protein
MATAVQSFSGMLRRQIEQTLAAKGGARLQLAPRLVRDGAGTGFAGLDAALPGGFPIGGTTEIVGSRSSGRATIAAAYLAERTREGLVCAWVDVGGDLSPEAAAANGVDLARVLWVRCGGNERNAEDGEAARRTLRADLRLVGYGRDKTIGTPGVANRPLGEVRTVQVSEDRMPKRRGSAVMQSRPAILPSRYEQERKPGAAVGLQVVQSGARAIAPAKKPWGRLEQGIKSVDLLVQAGGFGAIVFDMGGIGSEFARKIPLATWFRWRAALERTRTSLLVLSPACGAGSRIGCAGSSAELVVRVEACLPAEGTVMGGVPFRLEVVRRRFEEGLDMARKKGVRSAASWESRAVWGAS